MLKLRLISSIMVFTAITAIILGTNSTRTVAALIKHSQNQETENTAADDVSADNIRSGYFKIDGVTYKLPLNCQEFLNQGWQLDPAVNETKLAPGNDLRTKMTKGDEVLYVRIGNSEDEKKNITSLPVIELDIYLTWTPEAPTPGNPNPAQEKSMPTLELPKGVVLLSGTYLDVFEAVKNGSNGGIGDIVAAYGEADTGGYTYVNAIDNSWISFSMGSVDYKPGPISYIKEVTICNDSAFVNKQTQMKEAGAATAEPTTEVAAYQVPAELGTDITSGIIELEGDLYQFPAPVSAFQKNGWELSVKFPTELEPGDGTLVFLHRGGKELQAVIRNLGAETTAHSNCFISSMNSNSSYMVIKVGVDTSNVIYNDGSLKLPGIHVGDSRRTLENLLEGLEYEREYHESSDEDWYKLKLDSGISFTFCIDNETDRVNYFGIFFDAESFNKSK